jgi:hypothetical protein
MIAGEKSKVEYHKIVPISRWKVSNIDDYIKNNARFKNRTMNSYLLRFKLQTE